MKRGYNLSHLSESKLAQERGATGTPAVCKSEFRAPPPCTFFDGLGPVAQVPVPKGQTLTAQFYASVVFV